MSYCARNLRVSYDGEHPTVAINQIQFQPGMSIPEVLRRLGTEAQCAHIVLAPHALVAGPGLDDRVVHAEVLARQQHALLSAISTSR
jgi:hypothetical protein